MCMLVVCIKRLMLRPAWRGRKTSSCRGVFFLLLRLRIYVHNVFQDPVCGILGDLLAGVKYNVIIIFSLAYNHLKQRQTLLCFVLHCNEPFPCAGGDVGPLPRSRPRSSAVFLQDGKTQRRLRRGPSARQCRVERES